MHWLAQERRGARVVLFGMLVDLVSIDAGWVSFLLRVLVCEEQDVGVTPCTQISREVEDLVGVDVCANGVERDVLLSFAQRCVWERIEERYSWRFGENLHVPFAHALDVFG